MTSDSLKKKKKGYFAITTLLVAVFSIGLVFFETFIILIFGMLPTLCAYFIDYSKRKYLTQTIGYMNLLGCFIVLIDLWRSFNTVEQSLGLLSTPLNWVIMYGSAAVGWALYLFFPPFVSYYLSYMNEERLKSQYKKIDTLFEEWGEDVKQKIPEGLIDVTGNPEIERLVKKYGQGPANTQPANTQPANTQPANTQQEKKAPEKK